MPKTFRRIWTIPILMAGCLAGAILIRPLLDLQIDPASNHTNMVHEIAKILHISAEALAGAIIGGVISLLLIPLVFYHDPEIRNMPERPEISGWNEFTHPTALPMTIASVWLLVVIVLIFVFHKISDKPLGTYTGAILAIPLAFLFGLSGFQMIRRNEIVGRFGKIHKGLWAYLNGTLLIAFGWGGLVYLLLAWIFKR